MILYPKRRCRAHVTSLDLAWASHNLSFRGRLFQFLAENVLLALKRKAIPDESMSIDARHRTRLVSMLGNFISCRIGGREHRGVLIGVEPERYAPNDVVFLIIAGVEIPLRVRLEISELADGTAKCDIMAEEQDVDGDVDCVLVETPQ
jgi:hypothetical protein